MPMRFRRSPLVALSIIAALGLAACGSGFSESGGGATPGGTASGLANETPNSNTVSVLIGSSGSAETQAVTSAVDAWSKKTGIKTEVIVANDLTQQASQGFAGGNPADVLYVSTDQLAGWAGNGSLYPYGDEMPNKSDFYPSLVSAFTVNGKLVCAPKDFSTLALVINTEMWKDAGLTSDDYPKTWADLESVSKKLTEGKRVGLAFSPEIARLGVFLAQNGGALVSADGKTATANSPENVEALTFVQKMMKEGVASYSSTLGSGWGGEAFGKKQAAMVIEGNWITGAMSSDYKDVKFKVVQLPKEKQQGTLQFTNCWGISTDGDNKGGAFDLVKYLTATDQQIAFSKAFGVMPSVQSASDAFRQEFPASVAFIDSAPYAQNLPAMQGASDAIRDLNSQLEGLQNGSPKAILDSAQQNFEAIVG